MICKKLQLNDDKSELLIIASRHQMSKIQCHSLHIGNSVINAKPSVRNLGVQFDSEMSMSAHVNLTCRENQYMLLYDSAMHGGGGGGGMSIKNGPVYYARIQVLFHMVNQVIFAGVPTRTIYPCVYTCNGAFSNDPAVSFFQCTIQYKI